MTDASRPADNQYIAEFIDGPFEGRIEHRILVEGKYDDEISEMASVEGQERLFWYVAQDSRELGGVLHVRYREDVRDSDPVQDDNADVDSLRF